MNIIIVDDDTLVTEALKTILESSGKVTVTATGSDGTEDYIKNSSLTFCSPIFK